MRRGSREAAEAPRVITPPFAGLMIDLLRAPTRHAALYHMGDGSRFRRRLNGRSRDHAPTQHAAMMAMSALLVSRRRELADISTLAASDDVLSRRRHATGRRRAPLLVAPFYEYAL